MRLGIRKATPPFGTSGGSPRIDRHSMNEPETRTGRTESWFHSVERVVADRGTYAIVEKTGRAGDVVQMEAPGTEL